VGTIGNAARTLLRGPGINNWDVSLYKNFPIRERVRLQLRGEFYNAFNRAVQRPGHGRALRRCGPAGEPRLGEFPAARNPRYVQPALRLES
jgi:hypothetical protein